MQRKTSLANMERLKLLPAASQPRGDGVTSPGWTCQSCTAPFDAFANPRYRCSTCSEMFCHGCVPLRALQSSYARVCDRCYKNLRGITRGTVLDLPPPDVASKLGELFKRGAQKPSAVAAARRSERGGAASPLTKEHSAATTTSANGNARGIQSTEAHDRDVAAYMILPTHVLEEFVKYFKREEDKQVEALSRWYEKKARIVQAKIDVIVAAAAAAASNKHTHGTTESAAEGTQSTMLRHLTKRRARLPSGERRLPSRRRDRVASVQSADGDSVTDRPESLSVPVTQPRASTLPRAEPRVRSFVKGMRPPRKSSSGDPVAGAPPNDTAGHVGSDAKAETEDVTARVDEGRSQSAHPSQTSAVQLTATKTTLASIERRKLLPIASQPSLHQPSLHQSHDRSPSKGPPPPVTPRRRSQDVDADHPFLDDVQGGEWTNPLADPMATLRGAAVLSPSDVDMWIHRSLTREGAEDLLLERDKQGSWLIRVEAKPTRETVELIIDGGTGSPQVHAIERTGTGLLSVGGHTVGRAGTIRALMHALCSGESSTDTAELPALSLDHAVLCDDDGDSSGLSHAAWDAADAVAWADTLPRGWSDTSPRAVNGGGGGVDGGYIIVEEGGEGDESQGGDVDDDEEVVGFGYEDTEESGLRTSAEAWLASLDSRYVHRGLSEQDAEDVLLSRDVPGSWLLREVLADEAWGNTVEAEVAVDRGGIPTTYRVSQCETTGRLVVDGRVLQRTMDTSVGALCAHLGLSLGDVVMSDGTGLSELEWDPVHEGLSLEDAIDAVLNNGLVGSWLIRVPGTNSAGADLVLHTGDGPPLCLALIPTERQTLVFDTSKTQVRVPDGEYVSFEDLVARLTTAVDDSHPAWLDLERAVPVWAIARSPSSPRSSYVGSGVGDAGGGAGGVSDAQARAVLPQTVLFDLLDGLLQGEVSREQFDATVNKFLSESQPRV